jgi:hypothetical protein
MRWRDRAACIAVETQVFFPKDAREPNAYATARSICSMCAVRTQCLQMVINLESSDDKWGMFGGLTPLERRAIRKGKS